MTSAEDYLQFGEMLLEGGHLNGKRLLSPKTVELMASVFVPIRSRAGLAAAGLGSAYR